jgi:hypothetical protein
MAHLAIVGTHPETDCPVAPSTEQKNAHRKPPLPRRVAEVIVRFYFIAFLSNSLTIELPIIIPIAR